jgi:hypothetical protein
MYAERQTLRDMPTFDPTGMKGEVLQRQKVKATGEVLDFEQRNLKSIYIS